MAGKKKEFISSEKKRKAGSPLNSADYYKRNKLVDAFCVIRSSLVIPILLIISGFIIFTNDQINDFMQSFLNDNKPLPYLFFEIFLVFWAHATWMSTRVLLNTAKIDYINMEFNQRVQLWLARFYSIIPFIIIIIKFILLFIDCNNILVNCTFKIINIIILNFIVGVFFLLILIKRRKTIVNILKKNKHKNINLFNFELDIEPINPSVTEYNYFNGSYKDIIKKSWTFLLPLVLFSMLLILFLINNIETTQVMGSVAILFSFLTFILYLIALALHLIRIQKIPIILFIILWIILCSCFNNNYGIRVIKHSLNKKNLDYINENKDTLGDNWRNWVSQRPINIENDNGIINYPVFLIAVEGGGLRSAYWSSQLLSKIQSIIPNFHEHIYILSGVSGGSVGISVYSSLLYNSITGKESINSSFHKNADKILKNDFLSPVTGTLFYLELFQRIIPVPFNKLDRSRALERTLEKSGNKLGINSFSMPFHQLWYKDNKEQDYLYNMPNIIFNTTHFENGNRVVISSLPVDEAFIDTSNFFKEYNQYNTESTAIRLSTATFLSARYPYITPSAQIYENPEKSLLIRNLFKNPSGHLVDGGYFENSGSVTLFDLMVNLRQEFRFSRRKSRNRDRNNNNSFKIRPYINIVIITNNQNKSNENCNFIDEMIQPLSMLMNTFSSRVKYSKELIKKYSGNIGVIELNMDLDSKIVPLGWFLSDNARESVKCYCDYLFDQSRILLSNMEGRKKIEVSNQYLSDYLYLDELKNIGKNHDISNEMSEEEKRKKYISKIKEIGKNKRDKKSKNDETNIIGLMKIIQILDNYNNSKI